MRPQDLPQNLGLLLLETAKRYPHKSAFLYKREGRYRPLSWEEFSKKVQSLGAALSKKGITPGAKIAILSENRLEWALLDLACLSLGACSVPVYTSLSASEIHYILEDSGAVAVGVSQAALLEKVLQVRDRLPELQFIVCFEASAVPSSSAGELPIFFLEDLLRERSDSFDFLRVLNAVGPDEAASLIYTSGTTGPPKGVILTHGNFIQNLVRARAALEMGPSDLHLSFLPLSHIFERMAGHYLMIYIGAVIAYAESMDTVAQNLLEVRPTFLLGVPRFYEKIRDRVREAVAQASPLKRALLSWAKALGPAQLLVRREFRKRFGGRVRFCVSGGAALPVDVAEFFADLGMMIYEGYGLTETSPVISVNRHGKFKFGSVGVPLEGIKVRIAEDGEIWTQSPCVMKGYYRKPQETQAVLQEGWFRTGDLGRLNPDGFLWITGRKKELIVTSGGKKVSPYKVEALIEKAPCILRCVLFGEGKKFLTALLVPRREKLLETAQELGISFSSYEGLLKEPRIYRFVEERLRALSKDLAPFEQIKYFVLLPEDFSQEKGELTPTLKVKREEVLKRYQELLLPFYEGETG